MDVTLTGVVAPKDAGAISAEVFHWTDSFSGSITGSFVAVGSSLTKTYGCLKMLHGTNFHKSDLQHHSGQQCTCGTEVHWPGGSLCVDCLPAVHPV